MFFSRLLTLALVANTLFNTEVEWTKCTHNTW